MQSQITTRELPKSWNWVTLSEISKLFDCKHYTPTYVVKGIPLIRTNDIKPGFFDFGNTVYVSREDYEKLTDINKPQAQDIVFAREGSFGVASYIKENREYAIGQRTMILRADRTKVDPIYLTTFINSPICQEYLLKLSMGTTVKRVNVTDVKELPILIPPISEQRRIASIAQKCDRLRRTRRYTQQLSDSYLRSVFLEMFGDPKTNPKGWELITLEDLLVSAKDGPHVSPDYTSSGIPFLSTRNIRPGEVIWDDLKFISCKDAEEFWRRGKPERGDILYTKGGTTGLAKAIDFDREIAVWVHIAVLKVKQNLVVPSWLENMLNSDYCYKQSQELTFGIVNRDLGLQRMPRIKMYLPPFDLQEKFARIVQHFERLRIQQREADRQAEHLFQTVLDRAFRGEL